MRVLHIKPLFYILVDIPQTQWYRGVPEAAGRFMVRWHENEAQMSRHRRASAVGGVQEDEGGEEWKETRPRECGEGGGQEESKGNRGGRNSEGDGRQGSKGPGRLGSKTCLRYSCHQLEQLVRTWSSLVFFFLRLILCNFHFIFIFSPSFFYK